jgi:hypothetical protein
VFTGSKWEVKGAQRVYLADVRDPGSLVSIYNEPSTILDVPRLAAKSDVYEYQVPNPAYPLRPGQFLDIVFEPEFKDGRRRVLDLELTLSAVPGSHGEHPGQMMFELRRSSGEPLTTNQKGPTGILAAFGRLTREKHDPFLTVTPDPGLPLSGIRNAYQLLSDIESEKGIRMNPPPPGHLYFKAFLPNEAYRDRKNRPSQPFELHLVESEGRVTGNLKDIQSTWPDGAEEPVFTIRDVPVSTPGQLEAVLDQGENPLQVLLVFAPASLSYGDLLSFIRPVMDSHPTLFVFLPHPG